MSKQVELKVLSSAEFAKAIQEIVDATKRILPDIW